MYYLHLQGSGWEWISRLSTHRSYTHTKWRPPEKMTEPLHLDKHAEPLDFFRSN
jgi:hypothetical protein